MSDETTTAAPAAPAPAAPAAEPAPAPAAPAAAPDQAVPAAPAAPAPAAPAVPAAPAAPQGPVSRREARAQMLAERAARPKEPAEPATDTGAERPRDPATGQFLPAEPGGEPVVPDAPAAAVEPRAAGEAADAEGAAATESRAEPIRIEIPQGHPVREMGIDALSASSPAEEQAIRALVNGTYTRKNEVAEVKASFTTKLAEKDTKIAELQDKLTRVEAGQSAAQKWKQTPEYKAKVERFHEISEAISPEAAQEYWRGVQQEFKDLQDSEYQTLAETIETQRIDEAAQQWKADAWQRTATIPEPVRQLPQFGQWFNESVQSFNAEIELGHHPGLQSVGDMHHAFAQHFVARLMRQPPVQIFYGQMRQSKQKADADAAAHAAQQATERTRIEQEAIQRDRREQAEKLRAAPPHPLGRLGAGTSVHSTTPPADGSPDPSTLTTHQFRRAQRAAARQDAARHFGQR